jgi:O-antigen/teichoic acid export membrane protein
MRGLIILSTVISSTIAAVIFLLAKPIIYIIYGADFLPAVPVLQVFVWSTILATLMNIANQHLVIANKTKTFLAISSTTAVVNVALNYYLIPLYGIMGAAYATLISFGMYVIVSFWVYLSTKNN